jgi:hypothetical protein
MAAYDATGQLLLEQAATLAQLRTVIAAGAADISANVATVQSNVQTISEHKQAIMQMSVLSASIRAAYVGGGGVVTPPTTGLTVNGAIFEGDSTTESAGLNPWPAQWSALTGKPYKNIAGSSEELHQMKAQFDTQASPFYDPNVYNLYFLLGGTNSINNNYSFDSCKNLILEIAQQVRTRGFLFGISPILKRDILENWTQEKENVRLAVNNFIRTQWPTFADIMSDLEAAVPLITANYADQPKIHPNNTGLALMAQRFRADCLAWTPPVSNSGDDAITTNGVIDQAKWTNIANKQYLPEGYNYKNGPPAPNISGKPTWWEPPSTQYPSDSNQNGTYQFGNWTNEAGDFASNVIHICFAANDPNAYIGMAGYQCTSNTHTTTSTDIQRSWTLYGAGDNNVEADWWRTHGFPNLRNFVTMGNAFGRPAWATQSLAGTYDGFLCGVGANTTTNRAYCQIPANKKIIDIAVTSSCEFGLVLVWDVNTFQSEIVFISLCGLGHDNTIQNPNSGQAKGWFGEANEAHPGMPNYGNFAFMKVLGSMPLGSQMKAPIALSVTTGHTREYYLGGEETEPTMGNSANWEASEAQRQKWMAGGQFDGACANDALVAVISKTEKRLMLIDMKPMFDFMYSYYLAPDRNKYLLTRNLGSGAQQWPFTFAKNPEQMPTIIKTIDLPSAPTAVIVYPYRDVDKPQFKQVFVTTEDEKFRIFDTGGYPNDRISSAPRNPAGIVQVGVIDNVGKNVTQISPIKEKAYHLDDTVRDPRRAFLLCARGDASINMIDLTSTNGGEVKWRFRDTRVIDPTSVQDTDNHGTEHYIFSVGDYAGFAHNIMYGDITLRTYPGTPRFNRQPAGAQFVYGGGSAFPGKVLRVTNANNS